MAQDLMSMLLQKANESKTFADRLRDEREAFKSTASQFAQQTTPQDMYTSNGVALQPSRVSAGRQSLIGAVEQAASPFSPETELKARGQESDILLQLAQLAEKEKSSGSSVEDILKQRQAMADAGFDTTALDAELSNMGLTKQKEGGVDLTTQINNIKTVGERNGARAVKDILDVVNTAIEKAGGTPTGPLSALVASGSKLFTPNQTAKLQKDLKEILRTVRKESTGVAFSPQEIKELENEIPTILQQEGNVADSLVRLKQRMLQKLSNYGLDVSGEFSGNKTSSNNGAVMMESSDGQTYEVDASEAVEAEKNGWKRI